MNFTNLKQYGWDNFFEKQFEKYSKEDFSVGRVAIENKNNYLLYTEFGEMSGEVSGKFHYNNEDTGSYPAVGDWVVMRPIPDENKAIIEHVLERKSKFSRKVAWLKTDEQIIAANLDFIFIMSSLNQEINLRRIERYLTLASENNVTPVLILSKSDLCENVEEKLSELKQVADGISIHSISTFENKGIEELNNYFEGNKTVAVVGSSGVGKSTLINNLAGSVKMEVSEISLYKDRGRHTTSHRELILLKDGGLIIDTPGMRELQLWEGGEGLSETFPDVEKYLGQCKFSDCRHKTEPGCAILIAIDKGELDENRFKSYLKLQNEISYFERRNDVKAQIAEKRKWKKVSADLKKRKK